MNKPIKPLRVVIFFTALAIVVGVYIVALYRLQIVQGAAYYEASRNNIETKKTVTAARGNIMDRYGRVLVSNSEAYNLTLNTDALFAKEDPNGFILQMLRVVEQTGDKYMDELPITKQPPFEYTKMSSIQERLLKAYLKDKKLPETTTAVELMSYFRTRYKMDNNYSAEEMRKIAGIRYEINVRFAINTAPYVFVENASVELINNLISLDNRVIKVDTSFVREYKTQHAAHLLGYVGLMDDIEYKKYVRSDGTGYSPDSKVGKDGVELTFEKYLHGEDGEVKITSTAEGTEIDRTYIKNPIPGNHVYLTVDIQLQESAERALEAGIRRLQIQRELDNEEARAIGAKDDKIKEDVQGGAAVVVDVKTGNPLAIASYPTFKLSTVIENFEEVLKGKDNPLFNRALMGAYAPGSVFKPCTAIASLTEGVIGLDETIKCDGSYKKYIDQGYAPECWIYTMHQYTHGEENVVNAIKDSCNYYFYQVSDNLGITKMVKYAHNFGLGVPTGIELPETSGNMANPDTHLQYDVDNWVYGDTLQAGIGQSDSMFTPLQLAEYCATLANSGKRRSASILKAVRNYDYSESLHKHEEQVLSTVETGAYNWTAVQTGMRLVVSDVMGAAHEILGPYPKAISAKTGTSQLGEGKTNNGIFICYAPSDDPQIAIAIVVERGGAGSNLQGIARDIFDTYFSIIDRKTEAEKENTLLK